MRSDRDQRSESEREIDDFLSQFETPVDELSADINSYLGETDTTKMTAARTFYGKDSFTIPETETADPVEDAPSDTVSDGPEELPAASPVSEDNKDSTDSAPDSIDKKDAAKPAAKKKSDKKKSGNKKKPADKQKKDDKGDKDDKDGKKEKQSLVAALFLTPNPKYDPEKGNKKMKVSIKKIILDVIGLGLIFVLSGVIYALACITMAPKYDFSDIYAEVDTSSIIYDDEGVAVDSVYYTQNREIVKYSDMPEDLINSFIAIEDKTFWKHHGFNWTRMFGAILSSLTGSGRISGTSTITQQLARNVYLADIKSVRSIRRKIVEMYYASRIESALSKEEIIEAYLNSIYLGYGCYGVDAAARTYFSKDVKDLTLVECASLAALPQAPEDYALLKLAGSDVSVSDDSMIVQNEPDTVVTNDMARERRNLTLYLMLQQGYITEEEYEANKDVSINTFINPTIKSGNGIYSYYHEYLIETIISDLMDQYGMDYADAERMVYTKGLQIYSTVDSTAQRVVATEFQDASNFPSISAIYNTDRNGNMLNNDGDVALYKYDNYFDEDGNFILSGDAVKINSDGSVTIIANRDLYIYDTEVNGAVDYSLEFKNYYRIIDDRLYSIQGGYINVPSTYKSRDDDGNLVISADYFTDPNYQGDMQKNGDELIITSKAYSLASKTLQPQAAMVIVEVGTGEVKAMVGGRTFTGQKLLNRALSARQPGSSIKPLAVYGAALQKSYELAASGQKWRFIDFDIDKQGTKGWGDYVTVHSSIEDEKTHIENRDWPSNVTNSFSGKNTFKTALQKSINTCAVKLQLQVGNEFSMNQLKKFGITTAIEDETLYANDMNPAALALGAMCEGVQPLEMALAYAAFPGEGQRCTPVCYTRVLDRNGEVILEGHTEKTEALNEGVAFIMTDVLKSVVKANGYIHLDGVQAGGKTGTTNERYDIWFDGFTPTYAASLWIGTDQNVEMNAGSWPCAVLWGKIMNQIPKALTGSYPSQPSNVINKGGEYFTKGTETGLTSWSAEDEEKKEREKAYQAWLIERENHKVWVVDSPGYYKVIHHDEVGHYEEQTETTIDPETGEEVTTTTQVWIVDTPAYDETTSEWVEEVGHWEYEPGYGDGEFKWKKKAYDGDVDQDL